MIVDQLSQSSIYNPIVPGFDRAMAWLKDQDTIRLENGNYSIAGDEIFANVTTIDPQNVADTRFEAHQQYIDCHVILTGQETVSYAPLRTLSIETPYAAETDCQFLAGKGQLLNVQAGQFWIALPQDAHWPCIQTGTCAVVRKIIFKLRIG